MPTWAADLEGGQLAGLGQGAAGEHGHGAQAGHLRHGRSVAHAPRSGAAAVAQIGHVCQQAVLRVVQR